MNPNIQLWHDYMNICKYLENEPTSYPVHLNASILALSKFWVKKPETVSEIREMIYDTGVRGRVGDLSKTKLPKLGKQKISVK